MHRFAGSCRFLFNRALALQKELYEQSEKKLGYTGLCRRLIGASLKRSPVSAAGIPVLQDGEDVKQRDREPLQPHSASAQPGESSDPL